MSKGRYTGKTRKEPDPLIGPFGEHSHSILKDNKTGKIGEGRGSTHKEAADRARKDLNKKNR